MRALQPTREQETIIAAFRCGDDLVVNAGAGAAKTTTCRMMAEAAPNKRGIYLAYNRSIADESKRTFPRSVACSTAHSLAFRAVGKRYAARLNGPRLPALEVARILGINNPLAVGPGRPHLAPQRIARLALEAVKRFCYSRDSEVQPWHVPEVPGLEDVAPQLRDHVAPIARDAWRDLQDERKGRLRFEHDHYLKIFALGKPKLPCDYLLVDEAQDTNAVLAGIVDLQTHVQRIVVGDEAQSIYGWRGAVDIMRAFPGKRLALSQSFRFGRAIADEANKWLEVLQSEMRVRGFERVSSSLATLERADAVLCRTNAEAVAQVLEATKRGQRAALVGGGQDIKRMAQAAISLRAGQGTDHPELMAFQSWGALVDYVEQEESGADLKVFVKLIDSYGPEVVVRVIDGLVDERLANVVVSTAHKAKGREWNTVKIADDFTEPRPKPGEQPRVPAADAMLAYVTVTRAKQTLDRSGLAWIDKHLAQLAAVAREREAKVGAAAAPAGERRSVVIQGLEVRPVTVTRANADAWSGWRCEVDGRSYHGATPEEAAAQALKVCA